MTTKSTFDNVEEHLAAWHQIYKGFTDDEVAEIELIILDRRHNHSEPFEKRVLAASNSSAKPM